MYGDYFLSVVSKVNEQAIKQSKIIDYMVEYIIKYRRMTRTSTAYPDAEYSLCIDTPELDKLLRILKEEEEVDNNNEAP